MSAARDAEIGRLWRSRPRSRFARASVVAMLGLVAWAWIGGGLVPSELLSARRLANLERFLGEVTPYPLQGRTFDLGVALRWAGDLLVERGLAAAATTLAISVAAIVLAAIVGAVLGAPAARTIASPEPWLPDPRRPAAPVAFAWRGLVTGSRAVMIFLRAIPEYLWAFLFLAMLGPTAWPAVLALGLHNAGILGKLGAEAAENASRREPQALRGLGASRAQVVAIGLLPMTLPRLLLYFFYRWETCVREATVLGMLGIVSLGYWIQDARARNHYDEMVFLILLGAAIVLIGDVVSAVARRVVRRAS